MQAKERKKCCGKKLSEDDYLAAELEHTIIKSCGITVSSHSHAAGSETHTLMLIERKRSDSSVTDASSLPPTCHAGDRL
jgi:hypothetical protein